MHVAVLLLIGLLGAGGASEYARGLDARALDQETFDAETYGTKKGLAREPDGLRMTIEAGAEETGWKTPPQLKIGGDFTIIANLAIKKLPKPALEDGAAVGLAIAQGDINQPDLTLVRLREPGGADVYRAIDRGGGSPGQPTGPVAPGVVRRQPPGQLNAKAAKPPRRTFPAAGDAVRLELRREKDIVRFQVLDAKMDRPRYLGQITLGTSDIGAVKLFVSNRNGAEPLDVLWRDVTIRADRLGGLGTTVRTVRETVVYAEPTAIEDGVLIVGGPPKNPPPAPGSGNAPDPNRPGETPSTKADEAGAKPKAAEKPPEGQAATAPAPTSAPAPGAAPTPGPAPASSPAPTPAPAQETKPKARIPLDEVESIRFERTPVLSARFLGQENVDLTLPAPATKKDEPNPKGEAKKEPASDDALAPPPGTTVTKVPRVNPEKNGIRDVGLALSGLRAAKVKQVTVNCQADQGSTGWRLDTSDSHDWPLVLRRSGNEPWAELYLEPPPGDSFQKEYKINVVYEDGQNGNVTVKATGHTDPKRAVDPQAPAVPRPGATVHLTGEEKLFGTLEGIGPDAIRLISPWPDQAPLEIPLARVVGVQLSQPDRKESPETFARRLKTRGTEDLLLARAKDGEVLAIAGLVEGTEADRLQFRYQDRTRTLPLGQVEGWVMAARPDPRPPDGLRARASLFGGLAVSGVWKNLDTQTWTFEAPWGQVLKVPAAEVQDVRFRGGAMTYLCDLDPSRVEETPFFGHRMPWRRDVGLLGDPLRIGGQTYEHGVAVHSRSRLTYDLNGRYERFEAVLGFDDAARGKGRVDCRVLADGKEIFARSDLRADEPPVRLSLAVAGAEQLRLEVDFGRDQDSGDRVIWAHPRLFRPSSPASGVPASRAGAAEGR
jgi:hypothetical protein